MIAKRSNMPLLLALVALASFGMVPSPMDDEEKVDRDPGPIDKSREEERRRRARAEQAKQNE